MTRKRRRGRDEAGGFVWIKRRIAAFGFAFRGIWIALRSQPHFRIHILATITVVCLGFVFKITAGEWLALLLCIGSVLAAECLNSAVESLADAISTKTHPMIGRAKDLAAGAVLILAIISMIVGGIVFWPRVF